MQAKNIISRCQTRGRGPIWTCSEQVDIKVDNKLTIQT